MVDVLAEGAGMEAREQPRADGAVLGEAIAALADAGRLIDPSVPDPCATCAFRRGTMTNMMPTTVLTAFNCATGVDDSPFGCHHGMVDGRPTKKCAGWLAAQAADWPDVNRVLGKLQADLDALPDPEARPDGYAEWIARIDPEGRLDAYQRGRLWLRDFPS
jgi:hypothetical protein